MKDSKVVADARYELGRMLFEYRQRAGLRQKDLAPTTHYGRSTVAMVETGRQAVTRDFWESVDRRVEARGELLRAFDDLEALIGTERPGAASQRAPEGASPTHSRAVGSVEDVIDVVAKESTQLGRLADSTNISEARIDELEEALHRSANDLLAGPLVPVMHEIKWIRDEAFHALEGRQHPRQSRQLYAIAGRSCGLLATIAADRLRRPIAAARHAHAAAIAANLAEEPALIAWIGSIRSSAAFWQGRFKTAAAIAARAREAAPVGLESARLATLEARAWAKIGDARAMKNALNHAAAARSYPGVAVGEGVMAFPISNQIRIAGTAYLWIGDPDRARTTLSESLDRQAAEFNSIWHSATTRMDLATAYLCIESLDAAAATLQPLLTEASNGHYLGGAVRRGAVILEKLRGGRLVKSVQARQLTEEVTSFLSAHKNGWQTTEKQLTATGSRR
ncbi:helix-turn-helix domain-containing protein [Fodinicola acaciae]|uniref:helix-turn-helix domain-containing protein n=1 Tax=Fodinicola acaciae TaxID=2681555 RepID=UPI0013D1863D|nr:helix-turn-helix transcriptional regulator [Fodinicola acaciae]